MADLEFPWDEVLDLITAEQRTVPIIGPELSVLPSHGGATFEEYAAKRLAEQHGLQLGKAATLTQLAPALIGARRNRAQLSRELALLHRELLAELTPETVPQPLRMLAEIRDFPILVSTAPDALLGAAIRATRDRDAGPLVASLGAVTDLPRNWAQGPRPVLFHLFGRINAVPDFALTEEDQLEFLHRLQSVAHRPEQLFDELRTRHLLLIGLRLPDWALRALLRVLHGARLSEDTGQTIILAGDALTRDAALVGYLRETGRRICIYEEGSATEFMRELHKRWQATQAESWSTTADGHSLPAEPAEMAPGAVYVSAAPEDRAAAERLAALLDEAGLDVWFDRNEIREGARYETRLRQHLQQCDLFVPLLSPATEALGESTLRREWQWALEREEDGRGGKPFVLPVWVGAEEAGNGSAPAPFRGLDLRSAPGGLPAEGFVRECVEAVRRERAQRNV